ncbi:MAG: DNA polymerase I [Actinobacteria bacterium]|nr:DNA polymerase I [Actinomycetota bacterium]
MKLICSEPGSDRSPLFLLDGNNIAYRAFFALPAEISTSGGFPTNALYGFCLMIIKILSDYRPGAVIVAWDSKEKTFRHADFEDYKAQRKPMPDLLAEQWPYFPEVSEAFGFVNLAIPGYEADDILGTLARQAEAENRPTMIVTGDRDALQLAGRTVSVMANTRGVTEVKIYDPTAVEERFGVPPGLIPDLIGLKGDTSDNIPGVPGIGEKTAAELLGRFGTLEEVLAHIDEVSGTKRKQILQENRELALLSKRLATLDCEVPIDIETAELRPHKPQREKLQELFVRFEFTSLLERVAPLLEEASTEKTEPLGSSLPDAIAASGAPVSWEGLLDLERPIAVVAGQTAEAPLRLWLAQCRREENPEDYGSYVIVEMPGLESQTDSLIAFLARGRIVCHDLKSSPVLRSLVEKAAHDTYVGAYLLSPGLRTYRLDELIREAGMPPPICANGNSPAAGASEAAMVLALSYRQARALREQGMWQLFQDIELPLTRVLVDMEEAGINLDCYRLGEIAGKIQDQLDELESSIYELAGEEFNLGSPQQLGRILFEKLQLARQRKTKTGYSTDAKTLEALKESHPIVAQILSHRELAKLMSTYLLALPQAAASTGRLHTTFNQTVAATGRLSSSDPNLQNIPVRTPLGAQIRECFTAEAGRLLIVADYSQIELRIMAHLSGEPTLLEALRGGEDIHARTAAEVFGISRDQVDATHRRYAKAVNFGIMYGISAFGLSQSLGIDREEAAAYIDRYFERMPRVKAFIDETIETARRQGYVATLFGRRRPIPELASGNFQQRSLGERLAVNSVIQGTAADIIKVAMIRCHHVLAQNYPLAKLVLQVHDELIFEVPQESAYDVKDAMVVEMVGAFQMDPPLGVDVGVGPDWLAAK